jgi:hypothetical protein
MLCFDTTICLQNESEDKIITNDDVLGDEVPYDQQEALRVLCYRLLEMPLVSRLFLLLPNILCINFVYALQ